MGRGQERALLAGDSTILLARRPTAPLPGGISDIFLGPGWLPFHQLSLNRGTLREPLLTTHDDLLGLLDSVLYLNKAGRAHP